MLLIEKILNQLQNSPAKNGVAQAQRLVDKQAVLMTRLSDGFLIARVKDDEGQIYTIHSHLRQWDKQQNKCTCQHPMPCVHLIAGLIGWMSIHHQAVLKKTTPIFQYDWLQNSKSEQLPTAWRSDLSGDEEQGFQFSLTIEQDEEQWNMIDILVHLLETHDYQQLLTKDDQTIFQIINDKGKKLNVSWSRLKWLLQRIVDAQLQSAQSHLKLKNEWQTLKDFQNWSKQIEDEHNVWYSNQSWKQMVWLLQDDNSNLSTYQPQAFQGTLRPYQLEGIRWFSKLKRAGYGGILADDMGLGKTIQTLTYLLRLKEHAALTKPALIVVPTSLLANWQYECQQYTPSLRCQVFHGRQKRMDWNTLDVMITSYGMVQRHRQLFWNYHFSHLILDEAQLIKNFQSQKTQVLKKMHADSKFCLSGTPMENHLGELWSLFDFAVPNLLASRQTFKKNFQLPIEVEGKNDVKKTLLARIQPFMLRRTKNQVIDNLPQKTTIIQKVTLAADQAELYESVRCILAEKVQNALTESGLVQSRWVVLDALLKLRQICCDPRLLPSSWQTVQMMSSSKMQMLIEMLDNLMAEGRSVLVFSQFTKMLNLIEQALQLKDYPYQILTGKTQKREQLVDRFQKGQVPIFLLSLKAGGLGLNLTRADTVIHYEPWWNPAVTAQATDRIYRIGQEQPVFEYHLITSGSIEESMLELQQQKYKLFDETISASGQMNFQWTEADIMKFFSPL